MSFVLFSAGRGGRGAVKSYAQNYHGRRKTMNIRKPTDYTAMFATLDAAVAAQLPQMELYREIGRLVSGRAEKGAAVAASEYLQMTYLRSRAFLPATCAVCGRLRDL